MIDLLGGLIVLLVAGQAVRGEGRKRATQVVGVAALARELEMGSFQEEAGSLVDLQASNITKGGRRVASAAVRREGATVHIHVAGTAVFGGGGSLGKTKVHMA
jgi:hypothetical protein